MKKELPGQTHAPAGQIHGREATDLIRPGPTTVAAAVREVQEEVTAILDQAAVALILILADPREAVVARTHGLGLGGMTLAVDV